MGEKADIKLHLRRSAEAIGRRLRQKGHIAFGVGVKLKTTDFQILTHQRRLSEATDVTERLYSVGIDLLNEFDHPGPFRLVGMVAYDLVGIDDRVQLDLFGTLARQRRLEVAIDELAERFGTDVVYAPTISQNQPGYVWRRPLTSWMTAHAARGHSAVAALVDVRKGLGTGHLTAPLQCR